MSSALEQTEKHFVVIIPSYNNATNKFQGEPVYKKNLDSVFNQKYSNYNIIYIDDASTDGTGEGVKKYVVEKGQEHRVTVICNKTNLGQLENRYRTINLCENKDIIILLDGDDWLAHENVLAMLNIIYADPEVWITYGQYKEYCPHCLPSPSPHFYKKSEKCTHQNQACTSLPEKKIIKSNHWRKYLQTPQCRDKGTGWVFGHLYTFYTALFKQLTVDDLTRNGKFYTRSTDVAIMIPLAEMAGEHIRFIPDILYIYNRDTMPINAPVMRFSIKEKLPKKPLTALPQ